MIATLTTSAALTGLAQASTLVVPVLSARTPARHVQASISEIFAPQAPPPAPD
ncbi:hypothetical protein [Sediminimonas sp.]|uniref:hypothetical protein n=1 Tax=Sediminimonas sp. TaxID=2823379 RepID=UPI0025FFF8D0|nr:hypothetical protein [Sediminimonas sp.]